MFVVALYPPLYITFGVGTPGIFLLAAHLIKQLGEDGNLKNTSLLSPLFPMLCYVEKTHLLMQRYSHLVTHACLAHGLMRLMHGSHD
jgi:hypothetical protein